MEAHRNRDREGAEHTYLITWVCYGSWLPGQEGAVHRTMNRFGAPAGQENEIKERHSVARMAQDQYSLDQLRREVVLDSLHKVCRFRGWTLFAAHVRSSHVHVVATSREKPEVVMTTLKAYASRALNDRGLDRPDRLRWVRHGSTRYLWTRASVMAAIHYVVHEQGAAMAVYENPSVR
jgi:REP element-mobilizing transposase RayT